MKKLKELFSEFGIDAYIVPSQDEFLGEYTTEHTNRLEYITGFSGSNGVAVFNLTGKDCFFTDGRYLIQAENQLQGDFEIIDMTKDPTKDRITSWCNSGMKIGIDPKLHSVVQITAWLEHIPQNNLVIIDQNLVDLVWENRPIKIYSDINLHPLKYSGEDVSSKKNKILAMMKESSVEAFVITDPHSVCWLLNIRGRDLLHTPLVLSRAILYEDGSLELFCSNPCSDQVRKCFKKNNITLLKEDHFEIKLADLKEAKVRITSKASYWLKMNLPNAMCDADYCESLQSYKNNVEIQGAIAAHIKDGRAVSKLIAWVKEGHRAGRKMTELDVSAKALEFRSEEEGFVCPSFSTIAGFKGNGAIIHYKPSEETSIEISGNGVLLIDSGGQYFDGTTDITRTIAIGTPTQEQKHDFTLVLKGAIRLMSVRISPDTAGKDLDILARQDLKAEGKDYAHGTGHGVGSFLSVHEWPRAVFSSPSGIFKPGMIFSIEPGFYKENEYGIRIENLVLVQEDPTGMLEFKVLTVVPIDEELVDFGMLTETEKAWVKQYNNRSTL